MKETVDAGPWWWGGRLLKLPIWGTSPVRWNIRPEFVECCKIMAL